MLQKKRRAAALLLTLAMVITSLMPTNAYAKANTQYVTRAYVLQQVEKLLGATETTPDIDNVKDVKKTSSYYKTMAVAMKAGLVKPDNKNKLYPTKKATKRYVAGVLAKVSETTTKKILGSRNPDAKLTKTTLKKMLNNIYPNVIKKSSSKIGKGNVIISKPLTLSNKNIKGDLIIGDGVADKEVTLNNVSVSGNVVVRGGGENSIIITGTSEISNIIVRQVNNKVSLKVLGDAKVSMVYINDGSNDVNIVGHVGELNVVGKNLTVTLTDATVASLVVADSAENAAIIADKNSTVKEATLNAKGTEVKGEGTFDTINVKADDTIVTVKTNKINVDENIAPPKTDNTTTNPPSSNTDNNSSSSSTSGSTSDSSTGGSSSGNNTGESTGGNNTGDNTGGDNTGDNTEDNSTVTDERFSDGYPKANLNKETGVVTVTYKLKEGVATEEKPAEIYNVLAVGNANWDATSEAVIHGHLGWAEKGNHMCSPANQYDYLVIADALEHKLEYTLPDSVNNGLVIYSVIDCDNKLSENPSKIYFDKETAGTFLWNSINVSEIAVNFERTKVYIYYHQELDISSVPGVDAFSFQQAGTILQNIKVNNVEINNKPHAGYVLLTLNQPLPVNATVHYAKPDINAIQDTFANKSESFDKSFSIAGNSISDVIVSDDGYYMSLTVPISYIHTEVGGLSGGDVEIWLNGQQISPNTIRWASSIESSNALVKLDSPITSAITSGALVVKPVTGKTLYDMAEDTHESFTTNQGIRFEEKITLSNPVYHKSEEIMLIEVTGMNDSGRFNSMYACDFVLKVGEKEYRIRGGARWERNGQNLYLRIEKDSLKHISIPEGVTVQIKYSPLQPERGGLSYQSGKPMEATEYVDVAIE